MTWFNAANAAEAHEVLSRLGRDVGHPQIATTHLGAVQSGSYDVTGSAVRALWETEFPRGDGADGERELVAKAKAGDAASAQRLLESYMPLIKRLTGRYDGAAGAHDDARQQAVLGFFRAVHETPEGGRVRPAVAHTVVRALDELGFEHDAASIPTRTLQRFSQVMRAANDDEFLGAELAPSYGMSEDTFWDCYRAACYDGRADSLSLPEEQHPGTDAGYGEVDDRLSPDEHLVALAMATPDLTDRERSVVRESTIGGRTDADVAKGLGVDRTRVVHNRRSALRKIRRHIYGEYRPVPQVFSTDELTLAGERYAAFEASRRAACEALGATFEPVKGDYYLSSRKARTAVWRERFKDVPLFTVVWTYDPARYSGGGPINKRQSAGAGEDA